MKGERLQPYPPVLLLVEDNADDQRFITWAIRKAALPITVSLVGDAEEAIDCLSRWSLPDKMIQERVFLILSDVNLPRKSGWEVLQWARQHPPFLHTPVLMWTSLPNPEGERKARELGATSYFSKPLTPEGYGKLLAAIGSFLRD